MPHKSIILAAAISLMAVAAVEAAVPPNTPTPMPKVQADMKSVVDKTSTDLFNVASMADPENGPDQKLPDAKGWAQMKSDADKLHKVALSLQDPKIGKTTEPEWSKQAQAFVDLTAVAAKAATDKNPKALAQAANDMSDNCAACHKVYKKQS
jgi:cytochrome c556